ncbi:RNA polymerase sigma factor [Jiulongibacter sediminis]|uniref:RNA polymerase sigma70 factor n=1 Tax=Jiulongibacter sediminis TaxID=1605367 RepID=A0A0P7BXG8_9BACT|nr:sigma-70 family RNA polymerase sigma factor [Jiulongibacter sediminis]KPM46806.1 RNA polymerase sigma70 factor [Jiulongibacter sediminis]TBX21709.1 RNA polymerase sigma70 factor [Jiulongibacter sediminis]
MEQAFLEMINQHRGIILKVCRLYEDNSENRRDLFQEIVLQLWRSYPRFQGGSKVSTWVYRVALNTAITIFRKTSKSPKTVSIDLGLTLADFQNSGTDQMQMLYSAIDQLNKLEKGLILLYLEDKNYQEMAEITGYTESNVGVKLHRIKNKLSNILNQKS